MSRISAFEWRKTPSAGASRQGLGAYDELEEAAVLGEGLVHQQGLQRVAGGGVVDLGVHRQGAGGADVGGGVHVHVAHAVRVAQHGDARVLLDVAHQRVAAARDDLPKATRQTSEPEFGARQAVSSLHLRCVIRADPGKSIY